MKFVMERAFLGVGTLRWPEWRGLVVVTAGNSNTGGRRSVVLAAAMSMGCRPLAPTRPRRSGQVGPWAQHSTLPAQRLLRQQQVPRAGLVRKLN